MSAPSSFRCLVLVLLTTSHSWAGFSEDFAAAKAKKDPATMSEVEKTYAKSEADNPDYYILLANYWLGVSQEVSISTKPAGKGDYALTSKATGEAAGSLGRMGTVYPEIGRKAPDLLTEAMRRFPSRIDIAIGCAYTLSLERRFSDSARVMLDLLAAYQKSPASFTDKSGKPLSAAAAGDLVRNTLYTRSSDYYKAETSEATAACLQLVTAMSEAFPKDPRSYNLLAALAVESGDNKRAVSLLEKAHAADPDDTIITINLADRYLAAGEKAKARELAQNILKSASAKDYHEDAKGIVNQTK